MGDTEEKKRMHLVAWERVTRPKMEGGLGIRSIRQTNAAFLAKLGWRVLAEPETMWSRVVRDNIVTIGVMGICSRRRRMHRKLGKA